MKNILFTLAFLLIFPVLSFAQSDVSEPACGMPFGSYDYKTSWNDERAQLFNFAFYLKNDSELVGYIFVLKNENETIGKARLHVSKITKYLTKDIDTNFRIEKSHLVIIFKSTLNESEVILQPAMKGFPAPDF